MLGRAAPRHLEEDAELLVSELVANSVLHTSSDPELVVYLTGHSLRVEVRDGDPRPPLLLDLGTTASTGRGMALLDRVASRWGVDELRGGKSVWFELDVPRR